MAELKRLGWVEEDLNRRRKGDSDKIHIAWWFRTETTMTLGRIAERLRMGTKTCLAQDAQGSHVGPIVQGG